MSGRIRKELEQRRQNLDKGEALREQAEHILHVKMPSGEVQKTMENMASVHQLYTEAAKYLRAAKLRDPWQVGR